MADSEKKIKLDELPDEGSSSSKTTLEPTSPPKKFSPDPRIQNLSRKTDPQKLAQMEQNWVFDRPEWLTGWLIYTLGVIALRLLDLYPLLVVEVHELNRQTMGFAEAYGAPFLWLAEVMFNHTLVLLLALPLFKFKKRSETFITVGFDGISTVKKVKVKKKEMHQRIFVKWGEITGAQKLVSGTKENLGLYSSDGKIAEIRWDLSPEKKKAIQSLLKGFVRPTHPLRELIEKELK